MERVIKIISQSHIFWTNLLRMIFVTVGTQNFNFLRLLRAVELAVINGTIKEEVIAQIGINKFQSDYIKTIPFLDKEEFNALMKDARFVISHSGTGSIISALKIKKRVIVAARLDKYDEHIDDHQLEILEAFSHMELIIPLNEDLGDLDEKIKNIDHYNLQTFKSNSKSFNEKLTNLIKKL